MLGELRNSQGELLDYVLHPAKGSALVVIGHGVTANKDRAFLVALAEGLAAVGINALRVSFSGNGASEGAFTESTITFEPDGEPDLAAMEALPAVAKVLVDNGTVELFSGDIPGTIGALLDYSEEQSIQIEGLHVRRATLEDVFLKLTGRRIRD